MILRRRVSRGTGLVALVGGLLWVAKAVSIWRTAILSPVVGDKIDQPPLIFEIARLLFALGLVGPYLSLGQPASRWGRAGVTLAGLAFFARLGTTICEATPGAILPTGEVFEFPYSLFVLIGAAGVFIGLILPGMDAWRARLFPSPASAAPLAAGLLWIGVGYIILSVAPRTAP